MIRVLIVAPSPVTRAGLESLAASSAALQIAGSLPDFAGVDDADADVVLAAISLDEIPPPGEAHRPPLVVISADQEPVWTVDALRLGVRALLAREASPAEILAAVEAAANGLAVLDPHELEALLASAAPVPATAEPAALTPRELEVLRMIADGAPNKTIAWTLGISEHTVKFHVASILSKLGASSRTEAVTIGIRKGLVLV